MFQNEKAVVRDLYAAMQGADGATIGGILAAHTAPDWHWRGMHPFYERHGAAEVAGAFWGPLLTSLSRLQRREDIFFAGDNVYHDSRDVWTCSMGHFAGLFDEDWLGIPHTRRLVYLPYAEFHRIEGDKIAETALFIDIVRIMQQAGLDPIPTQTAAKIIQPGPQTHDGILEDLIDPAKGRNTLELLDRMIADLNILNETGNDRCDPNVLAKAWHDDMIWYGPGGIGASYTIPRYQEQHQFPFRQRLSNKVFNGHVTRFAEGNYAGWFGWPNLNNVNTGGFLGLPKSDIHDAMRVVDIYRRDGDKLAENWVFIDILYYMIQHGFDLLANPDALKS